MSERTTKQLVELLEQYLDQYEQLEAAAYHAARFLQRKGAGQCANELAAALWAAIDGTTGEGE